MRSIPIDVLRAFVAVVEARGFTRAAEELGRSQPTVSLQVKRLEELVEAPLFERAGRFDLTAVGSACFDYGRRLIRLHDEMLVEAERRRSAEGRLRIGLASEFAARLTPTLDRLLRETGAVASVEVIAGDSETLAVAFRQNLIEIAVLVGLEAAEGAAGRWRAPLGWYALGSGWRGRDKTIKLIAPPHGSPGFEASAGALAAAGKPYEVVCSSADFAVRSAAVLAGLGLAPIVEALAPKGVERVTDSDLPVMPPLIVSLMARSEERASVARDWAAEALAGFEPF
jgi:DNA-binding transcriptional LysR family regulator